MLAPACETRGAKDAREPQGQLSCFAKLDERSLTARQRSPHGAYPAAALGNWGRKHRGGRPGTRVATDAIYAQSPGRRPERVTSGS